MSQYAVGINSRMALGLCAFPPCIYLLCNMTRAQLCGWQIQGHLNRCLTALSTFMMLNSLSSVLMLIRWVHALIQYQFRLSIQRAARHVKLPLLRQKKARCLRLQDSSCRPAGRRGTKITYSQAVERQLFSLHQVRKERVRKAC